MKADPILRNQLREWFTSEEAEQITTHAFRVAVRFLQARGGASTSRECLTAFEAELRRLMRPQ